MRQETFEKYKKLVYKESGISLSNEKISLLSNRIQKRIRELKINSEEEYLKIIELDKRGEEITRLIDAISTNVTYLFREQNHFDFLKKIIAKWNNEKKSKIRIWSAACSSGEEPYSIAITLLENLETAKNNTKILATDICTQVLEKALKGEYSAKELEKVPKQIVKNYFVEKDDSYQVKSELKEIILFRKLNLSQFPFPLKGPLDLIFCRNVMIYFDLTLRTKLIQEYYKLLAPGGYLLIGHSENLNSIKHNFKTIQSAVYQKPAE